MKHYILTAAAIIIIAAAIAAAMFGWTAFFFIEAGDTSNPDFMQFIGCSNWLIAIFVIAVRTLDTRSKSH